MRLAPWYAAFCALACVSTLPARVSAYSLPNHERLTREAVRLVARCQQCGHASTLVTPEQTDVMVEYNLGQDALLRKLAQWHFPARPGSGVPSGLGGWLSLGAACPSFEPWTKELWRRAVEGLSPTVLYSALGAALHYVQDIAVPTHAVPVFHPEWLDWADDFDDYDAWTSYPPDSSCEKLAPVCADVYAEHSLPQLLEDGRKRTLADLALPLSGTDAGSGPTWSIFWQLPEPASDDGFGRYGCKDFGETEVQCEDGHHTLDKRAIVDFASRRARDAIRSSAAAIVSFQRHACLETACTRRDDADAFLPSRSNLEALCSGT